MAFPSPDQGPTADNTSAEKAEDKFLGKMAQSTGASKADVAKGSDKVVTSTVGNLADKASK